MEHYNWTSGHHDVIVPLPHHLHNVLQFLGHELDVGARNGDEDGDEVVHLGRVVGVADAMLRDTRESVKCCLPFSSQK